MSTPYLPDAPTRAEVDQRLGASVIDFGTNWCGHCQRVQPWVDAALEAHPEVAHLKIEDGSGRPLGRSFAVKLWPTLVFMRDGVEVTRLVRPADAEVIARALAQLGAPPASVPG